MDKASFLLFDWGNTLMRVIPEYSGPMYEWPHVELVDGALDVLELLQYRWGIALASNAVDSEEGDIWKALERVGLGALIDRVYCFRNIGHKKPSKQFYEYVLRDLDLDPHQVVMVGDDFEADILGARGAGIRSVWLNEGTSEIQTGKNFWSIRSLHELPALLRNGDFV